MRNSVRRLVILCSCLLLGSATLAATVRTRDGGLYDGDVALNQPASVTVTPPGSGIPLSFPLSQIQSITLRPPLAGLSSGGTLPGDWSVQDVGPVGVAGCAEYADRAFTLRGEGNQFGGTSEAFHFVCQRLAATGELLVHIPTLPTTNYDGSPLDPQAKIGLMIRQNPGASDRFCAIALTGDGSTAFYARPNAETATIVTPGQRLKPPCWLKLMKVGDTVIGAQSADPKKGWQQVGRLSMEGLHDACIGMFVTSNKPESLATAVFDHVRLTIHGLKAEFFGDGEFKELLATKIEPAVNLTWTGGSPDSRIPAAGFTVRWRGNLKAPTTDTYAFSLEAHGPARLLVDGKPLIMAGRRSASMQLVEGASYQIEVQYYEKVGNAACRLLWSTSVQPNREQVPSEVFYHAPDVAPPDATMPMAPPRPHGPAAARGLLLADGTFLPGAARAADDRRVSFVSHDRAHPTDVPLASVGQIIFHPLGRAAAAKVLTRAAGVLMLSGDFVDGECQQVADGKVKISSVLLGEKTFDIDSQTAAAVYREIKPAGGWIVHTSAEAEIRATGFRVEKDKLIVDEPLLGPLPFPLSQLTDIVAVPTTTP